MSNELASTHRAQFMRTLVRADQIYEFMKTNRAKVLLNFNIGVNRRSFVNHHSFVKLSAMNQLLVKDVITLAIFHTAVLSVLTSTALIFAVMSTLLF